MSIDGRGGGVRIGILAVQGDVSENAAAISNALKTPRGFDSDSVVLVKAPGEVPGLDGLVLPGGESTTIGRLSLANGMMDAVRSRIRDGMPVLGICAGLIMLAKSASDRVVGSVPGQPLLGVLDVDIQRNAFGRQRQSFEARLNMKTLAISDFKGVFIRAPVIRGAAPDVDVLCELAGAGARADGEKAASDPRSGAAGDGGDGSNGNGASAAATTDHNAGHRTIVAVRKGNVMGTAFHPELSGDLAVHKHFVDVVRRQKRG